MTANTNLSQKEKIGKNSVFISKNIFSPKINMLSKFLIKVLPQVQSQLSMWRNEAKRVPNPELRKQALASLKDKAFHCQGGAIFAISNSKIDKQLLRLIIAYQTLCDYLDNLCDRTGSGDGKAFLMLHQSLIDAVDLKGSLNDYYVYYPYQDDGGYLHKLVQECQEEVKELQSYNLIREPLIKLIEKYINLQVKKHINWDEREKVLIQWAISDNNEYPNLLWQEYAAACGSTLGVFALFALAKKESLSDNEIGSTIEFYFPYISALHILLDYFIDRQEDRLGGDLNFSFYYSSEEETVERLQYLINESYKKLEILKENLQAKIVLDGLLGLYLSDKKVRAQGYESFAKKLINEAGNSTKKTYYLCRLVRNFI